MTDKSIVEFNSIKFLIYRETNSTSSANQTTYNLFKVFISIIYNSSLDVERHHIRKILTEDINIDTTALSEQLISVLVDALVYYIIKWPGWQRQKEYDNGTLKVDDWFTRFQHYLIFKCKYIIKNAPKQPTLPVSNDVEIQTDVIDSSKKPLAPYSVCVRAPPYILNNIAFEERNGDLLLRRCAEGEWKNLDLKQILHWPNICVSLKLFPEIALSRSNVHDVQRYIGLCADKDPFIKVNHVTHIQRILNTASDNSVLKPYSFEFFTQYVHQLTQILRKVPEVSTTRLNEIESVLKHFLDDISEVGVHDRTMCANVSVRYHIGQFIYVRKRNVVVPNGIRVSKHQNAVSYHEIIIPQMDFALHHFDAVQDETDSTGISFLSLNNLKHKLENSADSSEITNLKNHINSLCLAYSCTFCQKHMCGNNALSDIIRHLQTDHRAEQPVICYHCTKEFDVYSLAMNRWKHICNVNL